MAESLGLVSDAVLREAVMGKVSARLEISVAELARLLTLRKSKPLEDDHAPQSQQSARLTLDPTIRLLAILALHDQSARDWILAESWQKTFANDPEASLLVRILSADIRPENPVSIHAFLATLNEEEESATSGLLAVGVPEHPLTMAHDCWRDLERKRLHRQMEAIKSRLRLPGVQQKDIVDLQKEVLDLHYRLIDISQPLSPPLG